MATCMLPPAPARCRTHCWGPPHWGTPMCRATAGRTRGDGGTQVVERTLCITACTHVWVPALARRHPRGLEIEPSCSSRHMEGAWLGFADCSRRRRLWWGQLGDTASWVALLSEGHERPQAFQETWGMKHLWFCPRSVPPPPHLLHPVPIVLRASRFLLESSGDRSKALRPPT